MQQTIERAFVSLGFANGSDACQIQEPEKKDHDVFDISALVMGSPSSLMMKMRILRMKMWMKMVKKIQGLPKVPGLHWTHTSTYTQKIRGDLLTFDESKLLNFQEKEKFA